MLPCISKVKESFAISDLQNYTLETGLISQLQFGYVKHSSTSVALIKAVDSWKLAIDKGKNVVCAFPDLRKAFKTILSKSTSWSRMALQVTILNGPSAIYPNDVSLFLAAVWSPIGVQLPMEYLKVPSLDRPCLTSSLMVSLVPAKFTPVQRTLIQLNNKLIMTLIELLLSRNTTV